MYNNPESIKLWIKEATKGIEDDDTKMQMRIVAFKMADAGKWRGNISHRWKEYFDVFELIRTGQLKDLYL